MPFYNEVDDPSNFVISWTQEPKNDFAVFAKGYKQAAERLARLLLEATRFSDYEAYPVVFLYRHALELSLKHVIYSSIRLASYRRREGLQDKLFNSHDLRTLSHAVSRSLKHLFPYDEQLQEISASVEVICAEFSEIDPDSFGYRYPIDTKGEPSTNKHQLVNLTAFADRLSAILDDLDTIHFGLCMEVDIAGDLLARELEEALGEVANTGLKRTDTALSRGPAA
jgi:hypothetical protein